ncbi:MAG: TonB-dependent receptor [Sphingobacteriales bacterium]|nr:TonB-dependent receptor [Sphingobacteriales bacterium]
MRTLFTLLLLATHMTVFSQNNFSGKVIDEQSKQPIENATLYFFELNQTVTTNKEGKFNIVLNNKSFIIKAEIYKLGYKTKVEFLNSEKSNILSISKNVTELQEVVVTGNLNESKERIPFSIESKTKEDLFKSGKISLAENLASLPGISFLSNGIANTKPVIRGLTNTNIVFLNNGIKAENFQFAGNHPFISDEFSAQNIEVIKGPFSLIYGSDAVAGVINVIPENPVASRTIVANLNSQYHTNTNGYVSNLDIRTSGKKWFGGIHTTQKTHKDYEDGNGKQIENSRFKELNLGANVGYRSTFGNFIFSYDYALPEYGLTNQKSLQVINDNNRYPKFWYQKLDNHLFTLKNKIFIKNNVLNIDFGYQKNTRQGIGDNTNNTPGMLFSEMELSTFSYNAKYTIDASKNKLIAGFNGANINNDANDFYKNSNPMPDAQINDLGVFAVNEFRFNDKINLYAGVRYDYRDMKSSPFTGTGITKFTVNNQFGSFSGSIGSTYKLQNHLFKLNLASGFRSPNISELSQNGIHQNRFERGDLSLKAQRNYQIDFNYHFHINNLIFDFSPFYNSIDNYIYIVQTSANAPIGGGKIWQYLQNDANIYGTEFSIDYHPLAWIGIHSNYTWTKGELKKGGYLTLIPQNRLMAELKLEKEKLGFLNRPSFTATFTNFQSQNNLGQLETYTPSYSLLNLRVGSEMSIQKQKVNWYVTANNVFDEVYIDHLSALKPLQLNNMGRNIVFGLNIPITKSF